MKNKYYVRSRISEAKFREIVRYFSYDFDASKIAKLTNISRNSINKIIDKIRKSIFILSAKIEKDKGEFELDESYFGPKRVKEKEEEEQWQKHLYLDFLKEMVRFILR